MIGSVAPARPVAATRGGPGASSHLTNRRRCPDMGPSGRRFVIDPWTRSLRNTYHPARRSTVNPGRRKDDSSMLVGDEQGVWTSSIGAGMIGTMDQLYRTRHATDALTDPRTPEPCAQSSVGRHRQGVGCSSNPGSRQARSPYRRRSGERPGNTPTRRPDTPRAIARNTLIDSTERRALPCAPPARATGQKDSNHQRSQGGSR